MTLGDLLPFLAGYVVGVVACLIAHYAGSR